jgi:Phosphodiester glycosidase
VRAERAIHTLRFARAAIVACALLLSTGQTAGQRFELPQPRQVAPGIQLYRINSTTLVSPEEPMSVWLLRLDPAQVDLRAALANDEVMDTEVVASIAERHKAIAAINAGFFLPNGDPAGVFTMNRRLISDTRRPRGAVGVWRDAGSVRLVFARLRATAALLLGQGKSQLTIPIDGVDTTRIRGQLMLFTPSYHPDTDAAAGGLEWVLDRGKGQPAGLLRVVSGPHKDGRTKIPATGFVLSFGGTKLPPGLARLRKGVLASVQVSYDPLDGEPQTWSLAQDIVGGAGLLIRDGQNVEDWTVEAFNKGFAEGRHPRTMIGTAQDGAIWLVTVDGRQPQLSVGMTLLELRALAHRLGLVNALNLDGGGSTTMWVQGQVVNSPSDATGPRKVSDALIVRSASTIQ